MKIIDIGICVNNIDPKGIGRIRYKPYGLFTSEIAHGIKYEEWDSNDPFLVLPFLPAHINIIPQIQQSVKIIKYDTDKDTQNLEYVAGPFTSPHDLQNQTFASQHKSTTYGGVIVKDMKDIRSKEGKLNSPVTEGSIIKSKDTGLRGNYGSDVIFTENGLQLRGGMLVDKNTGNKKTLLDFPQMSKKMGRLNLKKFSRTMEYIDKEYSQYDPVVSNLKYVIEYEIDSISSPTELRLFVYKVLDIYGTQFNTNTFTEHTEFSTTDGQKVKLINTGNTLTEATVTISITDNKMSSAGSELREILSMINVENLKVIEPSYPEGDIHPFYFRPTTFFKQLKPSNDNEQSNKLNFINNIQIGNTYGFGLYFSRLSALPPVNLVVKKDKVLEEKKESGEQSFASLSADKVFITSTSPNVGTNVKTINFNDLNEYELTQEDYAQKIEPNTYGMVRGENLFNFLVAIKDLLDTHIHNINEPLVKTDPRWIKLDVLMKTLRDDLLNDSIRIN